MTFSSAKFCRRRPERKLEDRELEMKGSNEVLGAIHDRQKNERELEEGRWIEGP
jgi:hypothetical protein